MENRSKKFLNSIKGKLLPLLMAAVLLTLSLPLIPADAASASDGVVTYRAVLFGNTYPDTEDELDGPQYCIESMEDMLKTLKSPYTVVSKNLNSTKKNMEKAVDNVFSKADGDDFTLFYYCGHGAVAAKDSYTSQLYYDGALCFPNRSGNDVDYYAVRELKELLDKYQGKKALILDSCGSGAFVQTQGINTQKSAEKETHMIRTEAEADGFSESVASLFSEGAYVSEGEHLPVAMSGEFRDSDYYLLCSTKKGEYSYLIPVRRNGRYYYGGTMTMGLLEGIGYKYMDGWTDTMPADTDLDGRITLKEGYTYSQEAVDNMLNEPYGFDQKVVCFPMGSKLVFFDNSESEPEPEPDPDPEPDPEPDPNPEIIEPAPIYRLYNPNSSEHFLTMNKAERDYLLVLGWNDEGIGFFGYPSGDEENAVYRLYNNSSGGEHFYTSDAAERDALKKLGWSDEGIGWYSSNENGATPVYRLYNASIGRHHYTANFVEFAVLVVSGWNYEGTPFSSPN